MSDMPERIWADDYDGTWFNFEPNWKVFVEYVRADMVDAEIARLQARIDKFIADFTTNA